MECAPCKQPDEIKLNCRKKNLIYESRCLKCNPDKKKEGNHFIRMDNELEEVRDLPSIYVGETSRSISERMAEHIHDYDKRLDESHMWKHFTEVHNGEEPPVFKFTVVRFCRDALTRQVGESVRISMRKNTLNSRAGFNRSGISRLTISEEDKDHSAELRMNEKASKRLQDTEYEGMETIKRRV